MLKSLKVWIGLLSSLLLSALSPVHAGEAQGLYQAEVPVQGQSRNERLEVYDEALSQVVIKLTGDRNAPRSPGLAKVMAAPQNLVQQYRYQALDSPLLMDQGYTRKLVVLFDARAVDQALVAAELPLWGRTRPDLLVWLAVEDGATRTLVTADSGSDLERALEGDARRRGLPLHLPKADAAPQMSLGYADVWGDFRQQILDASKGYGVNAVLVGRINRANGGWEGRWSLYQGEDSQHWVDSGLDQESVVAAGIDAVADRFAQRYAQVMTAGAANRAELTVSGVSTLAGYARAMQYLQSFDLVTRVKVNKVEGDEVLFTLGLRGDVSGLERAIALGNTLRRVAAPDTDNSQTLLYQLLP